MVRNFFLILGHTLNWLKSELESLADEALECMESNIEDQNSGRYLIGILSAFDIS